MMADIMLRKKSYDEHALFNSSGKYGAWNWTSLGIMLVACVVGWGLVINQYSDAAWNDWQGYLLPLIGGKDGVWAYGNIGVIIALLIGFVSYYFLSRKKVAEEESTQAN